MDEDVKEQLVINFVRKVLRPAMIKVQEKFQPKAPVQNPFANTGANFREIYTIDVDGYGVDIVIATKSAGLNFILTRAGSQYVPGGCNYFYDYAELPRVTMDMCRGSLEDCIFTVLESRR